MNQDREIIREELHQLVWLRATSTVAKEFDLSDVGLAKICRKLGVKSRLVAIGQKPQAVCASATRGTVRCRTDAF
jgi:hypothetical protein